METSKLIIYKVNPLTGFYMMNKVAWTRKKNLRQMDTQVVFMLLFFETLNVFCLVSYFIVWLSFSSEGYIGRFRTLLKELFCEKS